MKNKINLLLLAAVFLGGCKSKSLDLSSISFNEKADQYLEGLSFYSKTDQKGHFIIKDGAEGVSLDLKDDGERLVKYVFMEESARQLNYAGLNVSEVMGTTIVTYNDQVCYLQTVVQPDQSVSFLESLEKNLGKPTEIVQDTISYDEAKPTPAEQELLKKVSAYTKVVTDEEMDDRRLSYPQRLIWIKGELIYMLTLEPVDQKLNNQLIIITKKAFRDRVIMGYHNPEEDPILGKFVK